MKGLDAYHIRVGDYRVIYNFDRAKGVLHLLAVGHRREVYRFWPCMNGGGSFSLRPP